VTGAVPVSFVPTPRFVRVATCVRCGVTSACWGAPPECVACLSLDPTPSDGVDGYHPPHPDATIQAILATYRRGTFGYGRTARRLGLSESTVYGIVERARREAGRA
jgi:hypothetical protein